MDGTPNKGFCGKILGTFEYQASLTALKPVLEKSNCHTLDRFNFRAHKDICGVGLDETWKDAVTLRFSMNHWSYVNSNEETAQCFEETLADSYTNLAKSVGIMGYAFESILMVSLLVVVSW